MSSANARRSASSVMALPPYLTTTTAPWKRCSHGSASASTPALAAAEWRRSGTSAGTGMDVSVWSMSVMSKPES